jgi:aryl carrier-like protein
MTPDHVEVLDEISLNANGNVDRTTVATLITPRLEAEAPQGELEAEIAGLRSELLGRPEIGRAQNFFTLGGDSLKATRFVEVLRGKRGQVVSLRSFFAAPTVAAVADALGADVEEGVL